jgi:hypothetical protein
MLCKININKIEVILFFPKTVVAEVNEIVIDELNPCMERDNLKRQIAS